jgi:hypothetical protein
VNHEEGFVDPVSGCCTNTIEGTWNGIKLRVPANHRVRRFVAGELGVFCWKRRFGHVAWESLITALRNYCYEPPINSTNENEIENEKAINYIDSLNTQHIHDV